LPKQYQTTIHKQAVGCAGKVKINIKHSAGTCFLIVFQSMFEFHDFDNVDNACAHMNAEQEFNESNLHIHMQFFSTKLYLIRLL